MLCTLFLPVVCLSFFSCTLCRARFWLFWLFWWYVHGVQCIHSSASFQPKLLKLDALYLSLLAVSVPSNRLRASHSKQSPGKRRSASLRWPCRSLVGWELCEVRTLQSSPTRIAIGTYMHVRSKSFSLLRVFVVLFSTVLHSNP